MSKTKPNFRLSRRKLLAMSTASLASVFVTSTTPSFAVSLPPANNADIEDFIAFSRFATGHQKLDATVGASLFTALVAQDAAFTTQLSALRKNLSQNHLPDVEAFEESLRNDPLHPTLMKIIRGWYSGVIAEGTNAKVYAFEAALMYQPARDMIVIPTYAHNGPNYWVAEPNSVDVMPEF